MAALSQNAAKVTEAQAVVKALAASRRDRRETATAASCTEVATIAVTLTTLVITFPSSPDVLIYSATIIASSSVVCTADEKTALAAVDAAFDEAIDHLNEGIEAGQSQLMTLTGATASPAEIAAVANETTLSSGDTTAAAGGTTVPAPTGPTDPAPTGPSDPAPTGDDTTMDGTDTTPMMGTDATMTTAADMTTTTA